MHANIPVNDYLDVLDHHTIYKSGGWWKLVALYLRDDVPEVAVYLFRKRDGEWKRQQKMAVQDWEEWEEIRSTVSQFLKNADDYLEQAKPA